VLEIDETTGAVVKTHESCAPGVGEPPPAGRTGRLHAAITTGFGSVWFAPETPGAEVLCELDPTSGEVTSHPLPAEAAPSRIVAGSSYLWYSVCITSPKVGRFDPVTGDVIEFTLPGLECAVGITTGFDSVWVTDPRGDQVFRLDRDDGSIIHIWTGLARPFGITTGAGSVWFTNNGNNALGEIDPVSSAITLRFDMTGTRPVEIIAGPPNLDGIWFTQIGGPGGADTGTLVGRYDPITGQLVEYQTPTPASGPFGIAAGTDSIWVAESAVGKVLRITS
jgi:streptogramin lyase